MRAAVASLVLLAFAGPVVAQPVVHSPNEGKYSVKFPGAPKLTEQTANTAVGDLKVAVAVYANSDGSVFMVSFTDFPEAATKPANHARSEEHTSELQSRGTISRMPSSA